jgi:23S rRNA (pseudouridine1915-N3)-methyltransferase
VKLQLIRVGKGKEPWADEAVGHYVRRLPPHLRFEEHRLKPARFTGDVEAVRQNEAQRILACLRDRDRLVALDERGAGLDTEGFAKLVDSAAKQGTPRLVFAIGGPYGHGPAVRERAWKTIRLSELVLNHAIARVVLVEQLYRASTLLWGGSYHH